ncbi:hypothetical protein [Myroides sp. N17-2]|uniref:hypothetical protein n=1 Tax=Myroides sp. N17-2 TaxID=2030799 RepID=UPI000EFD513A|nr:hypothetical protein [Myroides sp. N17-2]
MRKNIFVISIWFCVCFFSSDIFGQQVIIGTKQQFSSTSSILEFPDNDTRGMVLPKVNSTLVTNATGGTLIYDSVDKKIKYSTGGTNWVDLSINEGLVNTSEQDNLKEVVGARALIGNDSSISVEGVLVLDSASKAMVLPRVESPHLKMLSPATGTIVYDTKSNMICVFNGKEWAFWASE